MPQFEQLLLDVLASDDKYFPPEHCVQAADPGAALNFPAAQAVHGVVPGGPV